MRGCPTALALWMTLTVLTASPMAIHGQEMRRYEGEILGAAELGQATPATVTAMWLDEHIDDADLAVIDARHSLSAYTEGHIPGAQALHCDNLRSTAGGTPGLLFPFDLIETIIGRLGLQQYTHVVVYSDETDYHATFVATALRLAGLQRVSILEGGLKRWQSEGRPLRTECPKIQQTRVRFTPNARAFASLQDVRAALEGRGTILLDTRSLERYEAGHIPGAIHRPWKADLVPPGGSTSATFRGIDELRQEYRDLGIDEGREVIIYCASAHTASSVFYNLRYRLGLTSVKLYDGSWLEWAAIPNVPKTLQKETQQSSDVPAEAVRQVRAAANELISGLMHHLLREMGTGGPVQALGVCYEIAPSIASQHSREGMTVRRVSTRVRNTADTPDDYEHSQLLKMESELQDGNLRKESVEIVEVAGGKKLRYMRPIVIKDVCLKCHGSPEEMEPEVMEFLEKRYPDDQATGYKIGELRGAVSVVKDLEE